MRRKAREINPGGSAIMVGDFNAREHDEEYVRLLRAADDDGVRYVDAYRAAHPDQATEEATFHGFKGGREGIRIDWIIHSPDLKAVEAGIDRTSQDGRFPSDHYPVTAVLVRAKAPDA
jgi:endonuclease/exonuclease/phosphatase family metal-dependent hydrolase